MFRKIEFKVAAGFVCLLLFFGIVVTLTACSWEDEADVASYNISKEADNFNIYRHVIVYNNQTDEIIN